MDDQRGPEGGVGVTEIQIIALVLLALLGPAVVMTRDPDSQVVVMGIYGLALVVAFIAFQAPDVSLSAIVVGAAAMPLMILLTLARVKERGK
jgi:energy-converting hydrogenase B subunit D